MKNISRLSLILSRLRITLNCVTPIIFSGGGPSGLAHPFGPKGGQIVGRWEGPFVPPDFRFIDKRPYTIQFSAEGTFAVVSPAIGNFAGTYHNLDGDQYRFEPSPMGKAEQKPNPNSVVCHVGFARDAIFIDTLDLKRVSP